MKHVTLLGLATLSLASPSVAQTKWDTAAATIVRLPVDSFPTVPSEVRAALDGYGCVIPQTGGVDGPHNVVSGSFGLADQMDWVALCSVAESSAVHVVWGGEAQCPTPIAPPVADRSYLQDTGVDGVLFSRTVSQIRLNPAYWALPQDLPADSVRHDAVADAFYEKGAVAYYCRAGSWITIPSGQ